MGKRRRHSWVPFDLIHSSEMSSSQNGGVPPSSPAKASEASTNDLPRNSSKSPKPTLENGAASHNGSVRVEGGLLQKTLEHFAVGKFFTHHHRLCSFRLLCVRLRLCSTNLDIHCADNRFLSIPLDFRSSLFGLVLL